jgi:D-arabinitol 4-dehydrogenase
MLTLPSVHLVTITVTESGYTPGSPLFEYLACGLRNRKSPITIMCCDNIRQNGIVLETQFLAYLYQTNQHELADWIRSNVTFPSCMVDRITPRTTDTVRQEVEEAFPGYGQTAVQTEEYRQWVIEDKFASDFPDLTKVGVIITEILNPMKRRKLEFSTVVIHHSHISALFRDMKHSTKSCLIQGHRKHFEQLEKEEIAPSIDIDLPFDVYEYIDKVEERFSSSTNHDDLDRICMDGFTKFHTFVVPSLRKCLEQGKRPVHIYKSIVAWYIYSRKFARGCKKIRYNEPNWLLLEPLLREGAEENFVTSERLWGDIPKKHITFTRDLKTILLSQTYEKEIDLLTDE